MRSDLRVWWPWLGGLLGAALGVAIGMALAGGDLGKLGDFSHGAARFIGMAGAIGAFAGYALGRRLAAGKHVTRDGYTLAYRAIAPDAVGYRELAQITVGDVIAALAKVGYAPRVEGCDELGARRGPADGSAELAGANVAIVDPGVRGWVRLVLAPSNPAQPRALGMLEIWSEGGDSARELALFTLRALDALVDDLTAVRESSRLSPDDVALLTASLGERPRYRVS